MPTVRRAQREVLTTALPGVRKTAATTALSEGAGNVDYGASALGQVGAALGSQGLDIYAREMQKERAMADETALMKASNQLSDWKNQRLFDPNNGAFTLKGEAALPLPEQLRADYEKKTGEIAHGLGTPEQRLAFDKLKGQEWDQIDLQVRRHVFTEMQTFRQGELEDLVKNSVNAAQAAYLDPKLVQVEMQKATSAIERTAPGLGLGKEQVDARVRAVQSATHVGVIQNLLSDKKHEAARAYYTAAKTQISGEALDGITKALEVGETRGRAQKQFDQITLAGGTFAQQRDKAKQIPDPEERDAVMGYLDHEEAINERQKLDDHRGLLRRAFDVLDKGAGIQGIAPGDWSIMEPGERAGAMAYARSKAEGIPIKTDQGVFYSLMTKAGDAPTDFIKTNLLSYRARLSDSDFQQLAGLQLSIKNGERTGKNIEDLAGFQSKKEILDNTLSSYGIETIPSKQTPAEKDAIGSLMRMVDRRVDALQAPDDKGKARKVSNTEVQQILDEIIAQGYQGAPSALGGSLWNVVKPWNWNVAAAPKRLIDMTIDDVPAGAKTDITKALQSRRRPVTDQTILDTWREMQVK